jgi:hypothetical protein
MTFDVDAAAYDAFMREVREQPRVGRHMKTAHRSIRRELTKAIDQGVN